MNTNNQNNIPKHKVFISYHHTNDENYKRQFEQWGEHFDGFVSRAVGDGDIDPQNNSTDNIRRIIRDNFISDATVTIVLIGKDTWRRKYVDWEIASSIRDTKNNSRTGLIGILLPTYPGFDDNKYYPHTIPPRLYDNIERGFAKIYRWPSSPTDLKKWTHEAFQKRDSKTILPDNSRDSFSANRSELQNGWRD